jgi:subtilisin family serine protease
MRIRSLSGLGVGCLILAACGGSEPSRTPSDLLLVSGNNQIGGAGLQLPLPISVRVNDKSGDPVSGVSIDFEVVAGGGSVQVASARTNAQGLAATTWTMGTTAGTISIATASGTGLSGSPISFSATVQAAPASTASLIQGDAQSGVVGQPLSTLVVAEFHDAYGNLAAGQTVAWLVTGGGGSVSAASGFTDAQGRATASWTLGYEVGGGHALRAQVGTASATAAATAALSAGSTLAAGSGNNQTGLAGTSLAAPLSVRVRSATGQNVAKVPIAWAVTSGGGSISQDTTLTDANGLAAVGWTLGTTTGLQTVGARNAALIPASITLSANAVVPAPSSITGTISLVDGQLAAIRSAGVQGPFATAEPALRGFVRRWPGQGIIPNELLVSFKPGAAGAPASLRSLQATLTAQAMEQTIRSRLAGHLVGGGVTLTGVSPVIRLARIRVADPTRVDSIAAALAADPAVAAVGRNGRMHVDGGPLRPGTIPNDPNFPNQSWHYSMIDLPRAWSITRGSAGVIVAVLDNGFVFHHPALGAAGATYLTGGGNLRNDGYDFVTSAPVPLCASVGGGSVNNSGDGDGYDPDPSAPDDRDTSDPTCLGAREVLGSHGTHVAGTVGAKGNDGVGVTGVNWTVSIRPVRVLGLQFGDFFDIANGILYAAGFPVSGPNGVIAPPAQAARILSMSFGGDCPTGGADPVHDAIQTVTDPSLPNGGALIVVSAGNAGSSVPSCPAAYPEVLSVGAVGPSGFRASYSNFGSTVDLAAPGGELAPPADGTWGIYSTVCDFTPLNSNPNALCDPTPHGTFTGAARYFGTSMAAPHVAGVAALLLAQDPALTPATIRSRILAYATPLPAGDQLGAGVVNARNALTQSPAPARQILVRAVDAVTGAIVATVTAPGGNFTISGLPDGSYFVVAGEDEGGDGFIGLPGRRFGANGGISTPAAVAVSGAAGAFIAFSIGFPVEREPNDQGVSAGRLFVDGAVEGGLSGTDVADYYRTAIPAGGTYSFETTGFGGAFCSFALDLNTTLELLDQNLDRVGQSVDVDPANNNFCSRISSTLTAGTYYLRVTRGDFFGTGLHAGRYILQARSGI